MKEVVIIQKSLPQYRIVFFNKLREELKRNNINLRLIYGDTIINKRNESGDCEWASLKRNKTFGIGKIKFIWQPCFLEINYADLIIVESANKLLINYFLLLKAKLGIQKVAYWGHAFNHQASQNQILNKIKIKLLNLPSWWFAYTNQEKRFLISKGVKEDKITMVQNAIDTKNLNKEYNSISEFEIEKTKNNFGIKDEHILIYCGALVKEKKIDFLIDTANQLTKRNLKFKLFIIGSGDCQYIVEKATKENPNVLYVGPKFGRDKAIFFKLSELFLLPGAIGLAVLDSFAFETPIITTDIPNHGPEIEYLLNEFNGIITSPNVDDYVNDICKLLYNIQTLEDLKNNCKPLIETYNIDTMVKYFSSGILNVLSQK